MFYKRKDNHHFLKAVTFLSLFFFTKPAYSVEYKWLELENKYVYVKLQPVGAPCDGKAYSAIPEENEFTYNNNWSIVKQPSQWVVCISNNGFTSSKGNGKVLSEEQFYSKFRTKSKVVDTFARAKQVLLDTNDKCADLNDYYYIPERYMTAPSLIKALYFENEPQYSFSGNIIANTKMTMTDALILQYLDMTRRTNVAMYSGKKVKLKNISCSWDENKSEYHVFYQFADENWEDFILKPSKHYKGYISVERQTNSFDRHINGADYLFDSRVKSALDWVVSLYKKGL